MEIAKKRLVYSILRFGLPLRAATTPPGQLTFDFARNTTTGHLDGVISVNIMETDAVERERMRQHFGEPYRTLLGHLRHESGHFYWSMLVEQGAHIDAFRALFGNERQSYPEAIRRHHSVGPPADWQKKFVSAYAASHPWEDWAETWAHYLHMTEAVDTAESAGMEPRAAGLIFGSMWPFKRSDIYREETFQIPDRSMDTAHHRHEPPNAKYGAQRFLSVRDLGGCKQKVGLCSQGGAPRPDAPVRACKRCIAIGVNRLFANKCGS